MKIVVGTRGSKLALVQTNWVVDELKKANPGIEFEIKVIKTKGDLVTHLPLHKIGDKGLFTKEIEQQLLDKEIDGDKNIATLITVPGVGKQLASSFVAFLGDGSRYPNVSSIGAATGLVPRLDMSSTSLRLGHITKTGNSNLRSLLILAAWSHVRAKNGGALKDKYLYNLLLFCHSVGI